MRHIAFALQCLLAVAAPVLADDCRGRLPAVKDRDEQSVRDIEHVWLTAELRGDTATLQCLLDDSYVTLGYDGTLRSKALIIQHAAQNQGKNLPIPTVPLTIIVDGDAATAYGVQDKHDQDGKPLKVYFADSLLFHDGAWHATFSSDGIAAPGVKVKD
jgi:hypothetical protein